MDFCWSSNKNFSLILSPNHLILVSLDSLFHQLSVNSKITKFHHHLTLQIDIWPSTIDFQSKFGCWLAGSITFKIQGEIWQFRSLWNPLVFSFLLICELKYLNIICLVNLKIYTEVFISGFFFMFDFSIIYNKSNSSRKITNFHFLSSFWIYIFHNILLSFILWF